MNNTIANASLEQLQKLGGKLWEKHGSRRVYFNNLDEILGLYLTFYGTGNIKLAYFDNERISNSLAKKILDDLYDIKLWVELCNGSVQVRSARVPKLSYNYELRLVRGIIEGCTDS
jgi:hypothetical protein